MNIKRRYFDLRLGFVNSSPFIQAVNFVLISYNTILLMSLDISFWIYAPIFFITIFLVMVSVGHVFRKYQHDTDLNMIFEKQTNQAKILYDIMKAIKQNKTDKDFDDSMRYLKKISGRK